MTDNFAPPAPNASMEDNIRFLIQAAVNTNLQLKETNSLLAANQTRLVKAEGEIVRLSSEVKQLKEIVNHREQVARSLCVRIINLPMSEDEIHGPEPAVATAKLVYERVIHPLLVAAKAKTKIASVPALQNTVVKAYRLSKPSAASPSPPIVAHLISANIKTICFIMKKEALPKLSDAKRALSQKRLLLTKDLTSPSFAFLKQLKDDDRISRAWSVEGQIRFIKSGDPNNYVHKVRSVFNSVDSLFS
jgi:hypothetical protein